ncbi:MAG: hypothetical protein HOE48_10535 [Candidatus Latescibacteria bacterium]|jgi:hypothetical protein|nr:hypothetical protein [Candidatus Latescibacterota bacterium]MBT4138346.1 hypothetical protein [Candidatus Latescibacterota bacterium]MBT5829781.1 hypothetical protein [Candidatus Latescibacterota bacterium]
MVITREVLAQKLKNYLSGEEQFEQLISWSEDIMMDGEIATQDFEIIRDIIARLGVSDVASFGLSWEELNAMLNRLGYKTRLEFETI